MADYLEWDEPGRRGWVRALVGTTRETPGSPALFAGGLAAVAFVASMLSVWQKTVIDVTPSVGQDDRSVRSITMDNQVGSADLLSLIYIGGTLALLLLVGACLSRPELAVKVRMAVLGGGVGLAGIVAGFTVRVPNALENQSALGAVPTEYHDRITTSFQPGLFLGFAAVALSVVSIWLATPARRHLGSRALAVPLEEEPGQAPSVTPDGYVTGPVPGLETGRGLTVSAAEPIDGRRGAGDGWPR